MDLVLVVGMEVLQQRPAGLTHENGEVVHFVARRHHDRVIALVDNDGAAVFNVIDRPEVLLFFVKELGNPSGGLKRYW